MELKVVGKDGEQKGSIKLPGQFDEEINNDLISRAVFIIQSNEKQPYGSSPGAGMRSSVKVSKRRRSSKYHYLFDIVFYLASKPAHFLDKGYIA